MAVTLDGKTLNVLKWSEDNAFISSQYDEWSAGICRRLVKVYGLVRTYQVDCVEQNVAWASSKPNYFERSAQNGNSVVL